LCGVCQPDRKHQPDDTQLGDRLVYSGVRAERTFYEIEYIRGNGSVRALKRQIATLYFERSGLSDDKEKLKERARASTNPD